MLFRTALFCVDEDIMFHQIYFNSIGSMMAEEFRSSSILKRAIEAFLRNANYFISHHSHLLITWLLIKRWSIAPSVMRPRQYPDDVNILLENIPRQTSIIARRPRPLWIIADHRVGIGTRNGIALRFLPRNVSSHKIYDYQFSACDTVFLCNRVRLYKVVRWSVQEFHSQNIMHYAGIFLSNFQVSPMSINFKQSNVSFL